MVAEMANSQALQKRTKKKEREKGKRDKHPLEFY